MSKDKYKHAMEVIENWERVEQFVQITPGCPMWVKVSGDPGYYRLEHLNHPGEFRIKREPRRVFVNFFKDGNPQGAWNNKSIATGTSHDGCSETAVEFVEVVKL